MLPVAYKIKTFCKSHTGFETEPYLPMIAPYASEIFADCRFHANHGIPMQFLFFVFFKSVMSELAAAGNRLAVIQNTYENLTYP